VKKEECYEIHKKIIVIYIYIDYIDIIYYSYTKNGQTWLHVNLWDLNACIYIMTAALSYHNVGHFLHLGATVLMLVLGRLRVVLLVAHLHVVVPPAHASGPPTAPQKRVVRRI